MRVAIYARVSTPRQAQAQTIEQQLTRLHGYIQQRGWTLDEAHIYRDEGYSGAHLSRPGLDGLRDRVAAAEIELVLITAPDRLARRYIHQVLLIEELQQHGCQVQFIDRPMSQDPHDQLLLQIRGAVAEYERTLITERMRRGKVAKLRSGELLPWTRRVYGYQLDPERPRDPSRVRVDEYEAAVIRQIFAWYLEDQASLYSVAQRLYQAGIASPRGRAYWTSGSIRGVLTNTAYTGTAYGNRYRMVAAQVRRSALSPVGKGQTHRLRATAEWVPVSVPAIITPEEYERVKEKLSQNWQRAGRNNRKHDYLLRGLISCGACRLTASGRVTNTGHRYYACRGRADKLRRASGEACTTRYIPVDQIDKLVWEDLCRVLNEPEQITTALNRARGGHWLPQQLQAREATIKQVIAAVERQQTRLLDAYLSGVVSLSEFEQKRMQLDGRIGLLRSQQSQLEAAGEQRKELSRVGESIAEFCAQVRVGLEQASFAQKRMLIELLLDCVVVTNEEVEIRYVVPTSPNRSRQPFCHLRIDYRGGVLERVPSGAGGH